MGDMKRHAQNKKQLRGILASAGVVAGAAVLAGVGTLAGPKSASALTYQTGVGMNFTIEPSISVSLSDSEIYINNLAPGTSADSNIVTINVISNATGGYSLTSTVGDTTYNDRNLTNKNDGNATFKSIDFGTEKTYVAGGGNLDDKQWGYTSSTDGGTTWAAYSGLPLYSDTENVATIMSGTEPTSASGVSAQFKIAAKAATGQASGEYNNVINFIAVAEPDPTIKMQDVASWGETLKEGETIEAEDARDGKTYLVTRLADGNIWMTQNLDFDIVSGTTYTSGDTDIKADWTPSVGTTTGTSWSGSETAPGSYDPGDLCWNGTIDASYSGTLDTMTTNCSESGANERWRIGNYYNWTAAVAMNDSSAYTSEGTDVDQSICPAGWRLPTYSGDYSFQKLLKESGYSVSSGTSGNIQSDPFYFVYGGHWNGSSLDVGDSGLYWSSVVYSWSYAYDLSFYVYSYLNPQSDALRDDGISVRCVAR